MQEAKPGFSHAQGCGRGAWATVFLSDRNQLRFSTQDVTNGMEYACAATFNSSHEDAACPIPQRSLGQEGVGSQ